MTFEQFILENEDEISERYVERHFEEGGHGGDYDPLDAKLFNEGLWLDVAENLWYNAFGGNYESR